MEEKFLPEKINPLDIDKDLSMIEMLFNYKGELGAIYDKKKTIFKVWAPIAKEVKLILYNWKGSIQELDMKKEIEGVWSIKIKGNLNGVHYTYKIKNLGEFEEATDPYCKNISRDGKRSIVINMKKTNPKHWEEVKIPKDSKSNIIYELSVRDFTSNENSNVQAEYRGKYKGINISKDINSRRGLEHLTSLGITHVQLMPIYDFSSGESSDLYNWGYNPKNYNVPEQSYTVGQEENSKIVELKEMIMNFHLKGIKVVMDVVYNHHTNANESNFNKIVPKYYFRRNEYGEFSNGSGCGNEFA
ncbi:MAG: alpha-amylase family glycosyl hydrolase, partial [Sarcina sp.]